MTHPLDHIEPISVRIGFRVECHDFMRKHVSKQQIQLGMNGRRVYRSRRKSSVPETSPEPLHLESAVRRRDHLSRWGASNVLIIAIWLEDREVYDAEEIAKSLGYVDCPTTPDEETRKLHLHTDEIFITGGILASENRILAAFGEKNEKENDKVELVLISKLTNEKRDVLSVMMAEEVERENVIGKGEITKGLASELFRRTGAVAYEKYYVLVLSICGRNLILEPGEKKMVFLNRKQECHFELEDD
ncbi:uncharacterized protein FSUBG_273 [Fusarium subglutinans]|uniref:Uncharacterized protein n=1 Tax=Gibberella subglutinans TaxID=42677 RepID=A0A8H5QHS1_GIBSU|nr:uncharacterized protein FSUBG_273 [Fusarium subglutinans]KAF5614393.1 hypothetical protein FSUBG_273 [Fusarium subglutinans]